MLYGYLLLAALGSVGLAAVLDSGDSGGDFDDDEGDTDGGGTFETVGNDTTAEVDDDGTLTIDVGDDENGSLLAVKTIETDISKDGSLETQTDTYGLSFYLLPEGATFPIHPDASKFDLSDSNSNGGVLDELMASLGAQKVASLDLGQDVTTYGGATDSETNVDTRVEPNVDVNVDYDIVTARFNTDSPDDLSTLPADTISPFEKLPEYWYDSLKMNVSEDTSGTTSEDWFFADNTTSDQIVVRGLGGADKLETSSGHVSLFGGPGDDQINIFETETDTIAKGGDGNDTIRVPDVYSRAEGGAGDDTIYIVNTKDVGTAGSVIDGGPGNDIIQTLEAFDNLSRAGVQIDGGDGDDKIYTGTNDRVDAGAGNDYIQLGVGSRAIGGAGDDEFFMDYGYQDVYEDVDPIVIKMGAGADKATITLNHSETDEDQASDPLRVLRIEDFDTAEDTLSVVGTSSFSAIKVDSIVVAKDQSHTTVTVRAESASQPDLTFQVRLDGVTNFTEAMLSIT